MNNYQLDQACTHANSELKEMGSIYRADYSKGSIMVKTPSSCVASFNCSEINYDVAVATIHKIAKG